MLSITRKITNTFVTVLFALLVLTVFIQVVCRQLNISFPQGDELSRYIFVWLIYLGGTITIRKGMNITFDVILDSLSPKAWRIAFSIVNAVSCSFLIMAVILGANLAWINRVQSSSVIRLNMGLVMLAIPLGGLMMLFEQIDYYINKIKAVGNADEITGKGE